MGIITTIVRAFFMLLAIFIASLSTLQAQGLKEYNAQLHSYFSVFNVLPILLAQSEEPGDVYETPGGAIYARRATCFPDVPFGISPVILPKLDVETNSGLGGHLIVTAGPIAEAAAKHGVRLKEVAEIFFGHPSGLPQLAALEHLSLKTALEQRSDGHPCRAQLLRKLRTQPIGDAEKGVPWIIAAVLYATLDISVAIREEGDAEARAKFKRESARLQAEAGVEVKDSGNRVILAKSGRAPLPVAWRPAFISGKHFEEIRQLQDTGWMRWLKTKIGIAPTDQDILNILRNQFDLDPYRNIPRPSDIGRKMSEGAPIDFDIQKVAHLQYMQTVNTLFAVSWELYRKP